MRFLIVGIIALGLVGCGSAGLRPPGAPSIHDGPAAALAGLAVWAAWAAGVGLLCCGIAAWFLPNKEAIGKVACCCFATIGIGFLLGWIADHPRLVIGGCVVVLLLAAISFSWLHRRSLKKRTGIDLDCLFRQRCKLTSKTVG